MTPAVVQEESSSRPLIELTGVTQTIPGGGFALKDATCVISAGEFVAIVGTSGSGKTTLLSILGLLARPSLGKYIFNGVDTDSLDESGRDALRGQRMGFVFQNSYLLADEDVAHNVSIGLKSRGVGAAVRRDRVAQALAQVGLNGFDNQKAGGLSGGEKQRVAVARALAGAPDVILADEPTGALDMESSHRLVELLRAVNDSGTTVVVVTHDPVVAAGADRRIEIKDGVLREPDHHPQESMSHGWRPAPHRPLGSRAVRWGQEVAQAALSPLSRPIRSGLVLLAYMLGVTALVGSLGLAQSATGHIVNRLTEAASSNVYVTTTVSDDGGFLLDPTMEDGAVARARNLEGVTLAVPVITYGSQFNTIARTRGAGSIPFTGQIFVTEASYLAAHDSHAAQGSYALLTNSWSGVGTVVGATAAESLGLTEVAPGVQIWINDQPVDIIAILAPSGDTLVDNTLFCSHPTKTLLINTVGSYLLIMTQPGYAEPLAKALPFALSPEDPGRIQTSITSQLANLQRGINDDMTHLLAMLAWVILALSALTAGTTMFLSVQHRAPDIALRRAFGASRASIWRLFTYEGITTGLAGSILGCATGTTLTWLVAQHNGWPISIGLATLLLGLTAGLATGTAASAIPAIYAAQRDPAAILRTV